MQSIVQAMLAHHRLCDGLLERVEVAVGGAAWSAVGHALDDFDAALDAHLATEERQLFPALVDAMAAAQRPVSVMCMEHDRMRLVVGDLTTAARERDADACAGFVDTLWSLTQQHNMKEEAVLYPLFARCGIALEIDLCAVGRASIHAV